MVRVGGGKCCLVRWCTDGVLFITNAGGLEDGEVQATFASELQKLGIILLIRISLS